jgi:hypothetical protein
MDEVVEIVESRVCGAASRSLYSRREAEHRDEDLALGDCDRDAELSEREPAGKRTSQTWATKRSRASEYR